MQLLDVDHELVEEPSISVLKTHDIWCMADESPFDLQPSGHYVEHLVGVGTVDLLGSGQPRPERCSIHGESLHVELHVQGRQKATERGGRGMAARD